MAGGLAKMMKEAQKLEKRLDEVRKALEGMTVEGTAGGGAVTVTMNGQRDVVGLTIDSAVLEDADSEMLEDLLLSALKDAKQKSDEMAQKEMAKVAGPALQGGPA
ncbi:MAG: YbaB/EbfC family nucleoid-associated protein [Candidatus Eisenbacteria bacterium]|nr:YbaB/EbfC family nucleoid-associated protein [Candidatus Eisenbacteria bacterium]